jgi:hypothetical protein
MSREPEITLFRASAFRTATVEQHEGGRGVE